ncbi:1,4-dihydroxy-2-naphthoate octaprenyltransferase [BD1-7 clade bacterium]|uniref:1,4-dihydroxy-2-naphthoate octaprenyltransferase n=1 Tax=BD1-7 clade bacterium TaxID=2029982 RepID=A0A5S9PPD3_9GAMM|nr:1,4-dihydroxy-2-naphthoate octaprenyltransferase [BD1-7 clade bacterium]CAA0105803.1 1,4-dihydroxy-2-naphthoate octaprenyltransferase [BD1-7 clade bacterium]
MNFQTILKTSRPNFLLLPPLCVLLGVAAASVQSPDIPALSVILVLVGAIAAHVSVNMLNEYHDAQSGLDATTQKTPFSGGTGALIEDPASAKAVLISGILAAVIALALGVYFMLNVSLWIVPIGLIGLLIVFAYTPWINQNPFLCLISPGLGFGALMVMGTELVLTGAVTRLGVMLSLIPFFMVNNLLLVNQYPDAEADKAVGRYHALIAWGTTVSTNIYLFFSLMAFELITLLLVFGQLPMWGSFAYVGLLLNLYTAYGLSRHKLAIGNHPQYMAANVVATLLTPLIVGVALIA